jgi:8-oxo-dGTP pyrophosphatase MutT (NUDIX family)
MLKKKEGNVIFLKRYSGFEINYPDVVCCYLEVSEYFLMLLRSDKAKIEPGKWGTPAGKVNNGEPPRLAIARELEEETGIGLNLAVFQKFRTIFVKYPRISFKYHIFRAKLTFSHQVVLSREHVGFMWTAPRSAVALGDKLMLDEDKCTRLVYGI